MIKQSLLGAWCKPAAAASIQHRHHRMHTMNSNEKHHRATYYTYPKFRSVHNATDVQKKATRQNKSERTRATTILLCSISCVYEKQNMLTTAKGSKTIKYIAHVYLKHCWTIHEYPWIYIVFFSSANSSLVCVCALCWKCPANPKMSQATHTHTNTDDVCRNQQYTHTLAYVEWECNIVSCIHQVKLNCVSGPYHV